VKALIDPRSGRVCELREVEFAVAGPLFWLDVGDEVTTHYTYDGAKVVPPPLPSLEEVRGLAIERVEHGAEVELQAALGAKLPASVLLFQALSDELVHFHADPAPTAENYPLLASLVGKRGAVDLQGAAQLVAERRARWLQRAAAVEAVRLQTLEDLDAAQSPEEIDAVLQRLDWGRAQRLPGETR
jgi:thiamine pyrophosphate-dependent acetolactate synthase large subunit-like protein